MAFNPFSAVKKVIGKTIDATGGGVLGTVGRVADVVTSKAQSLGRTISNIPGVGLPSTNLGANISSSVRQPQPAFPPTVPFPGEVTPPGTSLITPDTSKTGKTITSTGGAYNPNVPGGGQYIGPYSPEFYSGQQQTPLFTGPGDQLFTTPQYSFTPFAPPTPTPTPVSGSGGFSSRQFVGGDGTGISGIPGGAAPLPGSLGGTFRSIGGSLFGFPTEEDEKKRKERELTIAENRPTQSVSGFFGDILGRNLQTLYGVGRSVAGQFQAPPIARGIAGATGAASDLLARGIISGAGAAGEAGARLGQAGLGTVYGLTGFRPALTGAQALGRTGQELREFGAAQGLFSPSQRELISNIGVSKPFYPTPTGEAPPIPSVKDLVDTTKVNIPANLGTASGTSQTASDRVTQTIGLMNETNQTYTNQLSGEAQTQALQSVLGKSGGYVKITDSKTGQINVAQIDPSTGSTKHVSPEEFQQAGLNIDLLPDVNQIGSEVTNTVNNILSGVIDTATGLPYQKEWLDPSDYEKLYVEGDAKLTEIRDLKNQLEAIKATDPYANQTVQVFADNIYKEEGVLSARALIKQKQDQLNAVLGVYEGIADEVRNDPDFSKRLKENRLKFLEDEQVRQTKVLQRDLDSLREDLKFKLEFANDKIKNAASQYNVYANERNFVQGQVDKINAQMEKASDNARAAFNTIVSNPELAKELDDREISFIRDNGYFPETFIKKVGKLAGTDFKSIIQAQTTAGTKTIYGVTSTGKLVAIGTVADVSQSGAGLPSGISQSLYSDLTRVQQLTAAITNNPNLDYAAKQTQIANLFSGLEIKYGSNSTAISIIRNASPNVSTTGNILGGGAPSADTAYQNDLQAAIKSVLDATNFLGIATEGARKTKAQELQGQLRLKYPNYSVDIDRVFKPYL